MKRMFLLFSALVTILFFSTIKAQEKTTNPADLITSKKLYDYVAEQVSEKYEGRLTGTKGYDMAAEWVVSLFKEWGVQPLGDDGTYYQYYTHPYTLVFPDCHLTLNTKQDGKVVKKKYKYVDEFVPGSTSGSGEVTGDVVYVGYGITAPELDYDEYKGVDVKGKIVLVEREVPVSPSKDAELFKKWRPYSFHQYKLHNAYKHGAIGMIYNYGPIANPNNDYIEGFVYTHVGDSVVNDVFAGTGKSYEDVIGKINKELKPQSFATGKNITIKNTTEHYPEGRGSNVIGFLKGSDPELSKEVIIVGAHLDHLGKCYEMIPGANDNASGVAVLLGVAEALSKAELKHSVMFLVFGSEEQAVYGSEFYLDNPKVPLEETVCLLNMDGVGVGDKISALAAENFPELWMYIKNANDKHVNASIRTSYFANLARPRLDAAKFLWKDVPSISFGAFGEGTSFYHVPKDNIESITPQVMEDLGKILFYSVKELANADKLNFRK